MAESTEAGDVEGSADLPHLSPGDLPRGELFYMVHELSRLISLYFDHAMAKHQLTRAQWWGMMHISGNEGMTQTELASIMQMGRASAGKLIERLEAKSWIERRSDATDSRVRRVYVSKDVTPVMDAMAMEGSNLFRDFLVGVSPAEETVMLQTMRKMKANAERRDSSED